MVPRQHSTQTRRSALADHAAGLKAPIICRRHGISERTLVRWIRGLPCAPPDGEPELPVRDGGRQSTMCREALGIVLGMLPAIERRRALRLVESRLNLVRDRGVEQLLGSHPRQERLPHRTAIVGLPVCRPCLDLPIATPRAAARWLLVRAPFGHFEFVPLRDGSLVSAVQQSGCTDVVVVGLREPVAQELASAGVRVWRAVPSAPPRQLIALLDRGVLHRW